MPETHSFVLRLVRLTGVNASKVGGGCMLGAYCQTLVLRGFSDLHVSADEVISDFTITIQRCWRVILSEKSSKLALFKSFERYIEGVR